MAQGRAAVNREGDLLRIEELQGAAPEQAVVAAVADMGYLVQPLDTRPEHVTRWYSREQVDELSVEEARVLAGRFKAELEREGILDAIDGSAAEGFIEETLLSGFRAAAETGEIVDSSFRHPDSYPGLTPDQQEDLIQWLRHRTEAGGPHG